MVTPASRENPPTKEARCAVLTILNKMTVKLATALIVSLLVAQVSYARGFGGFGGGALRSVLNRPQQSKRLQAPPKTMQFKNAGKPALLPASPQKMSISDLVKSAKTNQPATSKMTGLPLSQFGDLGKFKFPATQPAKSPIDADKISFKSPTTKAPIDADKISFKGPISKAPIDADKISFKGPTKTTKPTKPTNPTAPTTPTTPTDPTSPTSTDSGATAGTGGGLSNVLNTLTSLTSAFGGGGGGGDDGGSGGGGDDGSSLTASADTSTTDSQSSASVAQSTVTAPAATSETAASAATSPATSGSVDLVLEDIRLAEPATLVAGPAYRVKFRNQSLVPAGAFRVGMYAALDSTMSDSQAVVEVPGLAAGESAEVTLRMPQSALRLVSAGGKTTAFNKVAVMLDVDQTLPDSDRSNNAAVVDRSAVEAAR